MDIIFCGKSPLKLCRKSRIEIESLKQVTGKFIRELEVNRLLVRLRNSDYFIRSLLMKEHKDLLMYTKDRVVRLNEQGLKSESNEEDSRSESSDEHKFKHNFAIQMVKHANVDKDVMQEYKCFLKVKKKSPSKILDRMKPALLERVQINKLRSERNNYKTATPPFL